MKKEHFNVGDKVFAKIKGYPAWPAIILEENGKKYKVKFYGTGEIGQIKLDDLFYYTRNKSKFLKQSKRKDFNDSVNEIEKAILEAGTDGDPSYGNESDSTSVVDSESSFSKKRKRSNSAVKSVEDVSSNKAKKGKFAGVSSKNEEKVSSIVVEIEKIQEPIIEESDTITNTESEKIIETKESEELEEETIENDIAYEEAQIEEPSNADKPSYDDIVFEAELEVLIAYGEYVEKHKDIYLKRSVQERDFTELQVLPIFVNEKCIGIKIHENWCMEKFENEFERAIYDKEMAERALQLKKTFKLDFLQESPSTYCDDLEVSEDELKLLWEKKLHSIKEKILENLKVESRLLEIDTKIKKCLNLDKADPKEAIDLLEKMIELDCTSVMLKKHPHVVDMVRRLKKYVGNLESWDMTEEDANLFKKDAEKVREAALKVHVKFMKVIGNPDRYNSFWDHFNEITTQFREETKDLSETEFYLLTSWPYSRENFLSNYFVRDISFSVPSRIDHSKNANV